MLNQSDKNQVARDTNDSALRLYEFYISKKGWKHFNPLDYNKVGQELGWTARKTESCKAMLVKQGYLLIIKDTLKDSSLVYRVLLGLDIVDLYKQTGHFPDLAGCVDEEDISDEK